MLDYAQTHIFDAVTTCGRYQGRLLLILILHSDMHDITSTLPVGVGSFEVNRTTFWFT